MLVQHIGEVPDTLPVTEEARERLREQAHQLGAADGGAPDRPAPRRGRGHAPGRRPAPAARARARQGDPPGRRPLARVARLPPRAARARASGAAASGPAPAPEAAQASRRSLAAAPSEPPPLELEQLQEAWRQPSCRRSTALLPAAAMLARGAPGRARGRHAHARVSPRGGVPPRASRGAEDGLAAARGALRGDRAHPRLVFTTGETA